MAKIINVVENIVQIGNDDGTLIEIDKSTLSFEPRIGDVVDIFQNATTTHVALATNTAPAAGQYAQPTIVINNENTNTNTNTNINTNVNDGFPKRKSHSIILGIFLWSWLTGGIWIFFAIYWIISPNHSWRVF